MLPISPTPAPHSHPIISGIQYQGVESRGWRPEGTRDWLLVTTLQGIGYAKTSKGSCQVRPGDMLLIAPGTPQEYGHYDESSDWVNIWAHFEPRLHWLAWLAWPQIARGVMVLSAGGKFPEIEAELRRMVEISRGPLRLRQDAAMNSLERALIAAGDRRGAAWRADPHRNPESCRGPVALALQRPVRRRVECVAPDLHRTRASRPRGPDVAILLMVGIADRRRGGFHQRVLLFDPLPPAVWHAALYLSLAFGDGGKCNSLIAPAPAGQPFCCTTVSPAAICGVLAGRPMNEESRQ
jgi:hypothetical protein